MSPELTGETVTHYRILDKIGEGGMGVVYRAEDLRLGRHVALKFLSAHLTSDPSALERFQREARAASTLSHPNICALYDIGSHQDVPYLVMELLEGTTLRQRVNARALPLDTILDFAIQIADALDVAHTANIIHRDIKSANIFITDRGQVKMLDFGLAKWTRQPGSPDPEAATSMETRRNDATGDGHTFGTLSYMSPEQARGEELDGRSDLFSLGIVLYEMSTGRDPFAGRTSALVFDAILNETPPAPSSHQPKLPAELDRIVLKALEKDRTLRYQSAAELRGDLKRLKRDTDSARTSVNRSGGRPAAANAATPTAPIAPSTTEIPAVTPPMWARPAVRWSALAAVLLTVALSLYFMRGMGTAIDSVAVLPFSVSGGSADSEYLTDGITESVINGLTQLQNLRVSARSVAFRYKNKDVDPQQVGKDLGVKAVVTGRVETRNGQLIIRAEMMNVSDGTQAWGGQYTRPSSELLAAQDDLVADILSRVRPRATGEERKKVTKRYTDDAGAYQLYLQGRYHWNKGTIEGYKKSIEYFQQAIDKDAKYALAYTGLADSYLMLGTYFVEAISDAKAAVLKAVELDPNLAEAHVSLGHIKLWLDWDWPAAEREFKTGISQNGNSALAHNEYAMYLATMGHLADAIAESRRAQDLDPMSPIVNTDLGRYLLYSGLTTDAIAQFRKTLEFDPNGVSAHRGLGIALAEDGRYVDAVAELKRALELSENSPVVLGHLGAAYARQGKTADADATLKALQAMAARQYVPSTSVAMIYAAKGDKPRALEQLEKAMDEHDFAMAQVAVAPWFRSLRDEPRFKAIVQKLGLK